tara:strand:+ start:194 stop:568 length:375 start_codon:yes stop_codon:yes gene_type:complete
MNIIRTVALVLALSSCSAMPDLAITPISADVQAGGVRETAVQEDNMVKVQTGDSSTIKYEAEIVDQVYNDIQEYPFWLVWAFAVAMGIAVPSPIAAYSAWSRRRELRAQIKTLTVQLNRQASLT